MFDEYIMLSNDRIVDVWNLKSDSWGKTYDWNTLESIWGWSIKKVHDMPSSVYILVYDNHTEYLNEEEGKEFVSIFKGRYGVNNKSE